MGPDENALDAQDVANMLGVSRNTVYNLVKSGELASYSVGRKMRFTMQDVEAYIAAARGGERTSASSQTPRKVASPPAASAFRIAGNDIAADMIANYLGQAGLPIERLYHNSYQSLEEMYTAGVEAAVIHLYDRKTKSFNIPYVQRIVPGTPLVVMHLVRRRQGFLVRQRNPKEIRTWVDLLRDDVEIANRERGAGSRVLLDEQLIALEAGSMPKGYDRQFLSPLGAAAFVAQGGADVTIGDERVYHQVDGLDFLPMIEEDLAVVLAKTDKTIKPIRFLQRVMESRGFKTELSHNIGYDTMHTGEVLYEV